MGWKHETVVGSRKFNYLVLNDSLLSFSNKDAYSKFLFLVWVLTFPSYHIPGKRNLTVTVMPLDSN